MKNYLWKYIILLLYKWFSDTVQGIIPKNQYNLELKKVICYLKKFNQFMISLVETPNSLATSGWCSHSSHNPDIARRI